MMILALVGVLGGSWNSNFELEAFTGWQSSSGYLFPTLFITVACGAISGFHSLVASGTSSKQINTEKDAKVIGYGAMIVECILAILSLIAAATVWNLVQGGENSLGLTMELSSDHLRRRPCHPRCQHDRHRGGLLQPAVQHRLHPAEPWPSPSSR